MYCSLAQLASLNAYFYTGERWKGCLFSLISCEWSTNFLVLELTLLLSHKTNFQNNHRCFFAPTFSPQFSCSVRMFDLLSSPGIITNFLFLVHMCYSSNTWVFCFIAESCRYEYNTFKGNLSRLFLLLIDPHLRLSRCFPLALFPPRPVCDQNYLYLFFIQWSRTKVWRGTQPTPHDGSTDTPHTHYYPHLL